MAFADLIYPSTADVGAATVGGAPTMSGANHLEIQKSGAAGNFNRRGGAMFDTVSGPYTGSFPITGGRMRMLWRFSVGTAGHAIAMTCMHSVNTEIVTNSAAANFYVLWIRPGNNDMEIKKVTAGNFQTAGTSISGLVDTLAQLGTLNNTTTYATELLWHYDLTAYNGIRFGVKFGTATDYSDLTPVTGLETVYDTATPHSVGANCGIGWADRGTTGLNIAYFDKLTLYSTALV